ncbi:DNA repair protein RecO [Anaerocolumna cellulosilytica]|uniref:DNA repair protein RecO n=1 Tax=Anaerocolumna cellulosilytica TaxID=433286 RepID=A0A6S6QRB5_9FIRM|nr:DNA repair protein RecO [Anaerocolumna cellulosilytica]MBB5198015.1 DNA repair protein RecO (recombination protein O) [Anaerocolumna cellulosilytica]BCJ93154.1 DNA repair protein RecO [Anaerocolumna cellulosilytica]
MLTTAVMGMVLSAMPIGDYDKRLVLLTKEKGKITTFAKGARKPSSAFLACSQPFSFGEFVLYEGRSSYNIMSVEIKNYFEELRKDMEGAYYGMYFCELTDYFAHENEDGTEYLKLLYQSLRAFGQEQIGRKLIRRIFELRILALNGEAPQVFQCVKCRKTEDIYNFNSNAGGMICTECGKNIGKGLFISDSTLYTLQYIITSPIEKLYTFTVTEAVLQELIECMEAYTRIYIEKPMKSLELLEKLF